MDTHPSAYPTTVTRSADGTYRWSYDLDMWRNRSLLVKVLLVVGAIALPLAALLLALVAGDRGLSLATIGVTLASLAGVLGLAALSYVISALAMGGRYRMRFEMSEEGVALVRSEASESAVDAASAAVAIAGIAADAPGEGYHASSTLDAVGATSGKASFASARRVREHPEYDMIELRRIVSSNQVYVNARDYPLVRDFILAHVPERAKP